MNEVTPMTPERLAQIQGFAWVWQKSGDGSDITEIVVELLAHIEAQAKQIEQLEKDKARLLDAIGRCGKRCEHLHHEKKHQHGLGEDCPVENLVREAIDNANNDKGA